MMLINAVQIFTISRDAKQEYERVDDNSRNQFGPVIIVEWRINVIVVIFFSSCCADGVVAAVVARQQQENRFVFSRSFIIIKQREIRFARNCCLAKIVQQKEKKNKQKNKKQKQIINLIAKKLQTMSSFFMQSSYSALLCNPQSDELAIYSTFLYF